MDLVLHFFICYVLYVTVYKVTKNDLIAGLAVLTIALGKELYDFEPSSKDFFADCLGILAGLFYITWEELK